METRKCLWPLQISKSEIAVQKIVQVLQNTFVDPFNNELEKNKLYNLASAYEQKGEKWWRSSKHA